MADAKASTFSVATVPQYGSYLIGLTTPTTTPTDVNLKVGEFFTEQFMALTTAYTGTSTTSLQKLFNVPTNGAFNVSAATSYFFEGEFDLSAMSSTTGTFGFGFLGTATITSVKYTAESIKSAIGTPTAPLMTTAIAATATQLNATTTNTVGHARLSGIVRINAAGTLIPAFNVSVAAAAVVGVNSWFRLVPIGTGTTTSSGNVS